MAIVTVPIGEQFGEFSGKKVESSTLTKEQVDRLIDAFSRPVVTPAGRIQFADKFTQPLFERRGDIERQSEAERIEAGQRETGEQADIQTLVQEQVAERENSLLRQRLNEIFGTIEEAGAGKIRSEFARGRRQLAESEAALGSRLTSPVSRIGRERLAGEEGQALGNLFGQLGAQRAAGEFGIAGALEGIFAGERRAKEQVGQFGQLLGQRQAELGEERRESREERRLRRDLGIMGVESSRDTARTTSKRSGTQEAADVSDIFGNISKFFG